MASEFLSEVKKITHSDKRFTEEAYTFVMEGLHYYNQKHNIKPGQHITARQLLEGIIEYAQKSFGPMAKFTLNSWGIHATKDIGLIVYNMIKVGLMGKTERDSLEEFFDVFDFESVFKENFSIEEQQDPDNG